MAGERKPCEAADYWTSSGITEAITVRTPGFRAQVTMLVNGAKFV